MPLQKHRRIVDVSMRFDPEAKHHLADSANAKVSAAQVQPLQLRI
jgi:hypothetical protein